jgi:hypothetical protein
MQAGGANQTLTGGAAGKETMISSAAGNDTFKDTAALLNGDTVEGFAAPNDALDFTNIADNSQLSLSFNENSNGTSGVLNVTNGAQSASVTLFGQFMASGFHPALDSAGTGTIISYQQQQQTPLAPSH